MSIERPERIESTPGERLRTIRRTLARRRRLIIKVTLLLLACIFLATLMITPEYKATSSLYLRLEQTPVDAMGQELGTANRVGAVSPLAVLNSYVETLLSRTTAEQVVRELGLDRTPPPKGLRDRIKLALTGAITGTIKTITRTLAGGESNGGEDKFRKAVDDLRKAVAAEVDQDTELVLVTVMHSDRRLAQQINQRMLEVLAERSVKMSQADAMQAYRSVMASVPAAAAQLTSAEEALSTFKRSEGIITLTDEQRIRIEQLSTLESQHDQAKTSLQETVARLAVVQKDLEERSRPVTLSTVLAENPTVSQIKSDLYRMEQQLATLRQTRTEEHPEVVRLKSQIETTHQRLKQEIERVATSETRGIPPEYSALVQSLVSLQSDQVGLAAKEQATAALLESFQERLRSLPRKEQRLNELMRAQQMAAQFYTSLVQRADQLRVASASATPPVSMAIIDPPRLPKGIDDIGYPPYAVIIIFGPILSLIIGITTAFVAEYFDDTIHTAEEATERLHLPVLVSIPSARSQRRS